MNSFSGMLESGNVGMLGLFTLNDHPTPNNGWDERQQQEQQQQTNATTRTTKTVRVLLLATSSSYF